MFCAVHQIQKPIDHSNATHNAVAEIGIQLETSESIQVDMITNSRSVHLENTCTDLDVSGAQDELWFSSW